MAESYTVLVHPGVPLAIEARASVAPADPGYSSEGARNIELACAYEYLGYGEQWRDDRISHDSALTYSAVWGCVRVISQSLASVGWHVYERQLDGRSKLPIEDDIAWLLSLQANPEMSALDWRQTLLKDALTWGNGYAEIERTGTGKPAWLWRISPDRVCPVRDTAGQLWYEVANGPGRESTYLRPENVFHLKGLGPDGLVGWSVVDMAKRTIRLGMQEERFGSQFFSRGPMPGGFVEIPKQLNDTQRKEFRRSFEDVYSGSANAHRIVVLSDGVKFTQANMPNDDAQFLESRRFQVSEVCRWYGVPPHKLADLERATFSNVEEQERAFVTDCLLPWARRLESEADIKLYSPVRRGRRYTRLNLDALLRGNSATQTDTVAKKVNAALMTPNEGREFFDLNPVDGGDVLMIQGAMIPLDRAIEGDTAQAGQPAPSPVVEPVPTTDPIIDKQAVRRVYHTLLTDAYTRLVRVDHDKAKRAANKGTLAAHLSEWYALPTAEERVALTLLPVFNALCLAIGGQGESCARQAAGRHVRRCLKHLASGGEESLASHAVIAFDAANQDLGEMGL